MPCESFELDLGNGEVARGIICTRASAVKCKACGAYTKDAVLCDYPLAGKKSGKTCSAKTCRRCAKHFPPDRDLCPSHARLVEQAKVPLAILENPEPGAMLAAADHVEGQTPTQPRQEPRTYHAPPSSSFKPRDLADYNEYWNERAAIAEFLGEMPRAAAEVFARQLAGDPPVYGSIGPLFAGAR